MTVVSLNPLALFARNDNPEQVARFSRVFDVTLTLPINIAAIGTAASMGSFWNTLDYFGLRVRVSFLGSARAARLIAESETAFRVSLGAATSFDAALARVLVGAANANTIEQCAAAIASASDAHTADVELQCGAPMPSEQVRLRDAATEADAAARRAVDEADRSYVGLDLRGDFGDPTFSGLAMSRGVNALGALAFGGRIDAGAVGIWLRGRAGFSYSSINNYAENAYSADFGVAIALAFGQATAANAVQRLHVNLGLEGRFGSGSMANTAGLTNFLDLRLGVGVPVSDGTSIGVGASIPLYGSTSPIFTVTGNWALLFPDAAPARR